MSSVARNTGGDVVLLAPGANGHGDWVDRLAFHASAPGVGIVTAFTNANGTATYPRAGEANARPDAGSAATLDATFSRANRGRSVDVPDVFGPCRYITGACLSALADRQPLAGDDPRSAIDYCRRAAAAGFRSLVAGDVFVDCAADPATQTPALSRDAAQKLLPFARRVDLARLAANAPVIVFVSHAWGGGIRRHMNDLAALLRGHADVLYLEPAGADAVRLYWPRAGESFAAWFRLPADLPALAETLRAIGVARVHFHHVHGLPASILDLPRAAGVPYDCTLHDYFAMCPQYHLADVRGRYCGEPDVAGCTACLAQRPSQWGLDIDAWRRVFATFLAGAERVIAPSQDVATRMRRHFPVVPVSVWSHPERASAPPAVVRVVTLGNLSREKGLDVVAACAADARLRGLPLAFRVLGATSEPIAQSPDAPLTLHGSYAEDELASLLAGEHADVVFFPVQVPETYSYTLSVALASTRRSSPRRSGPSSSARQDGRSCDCFVTTRRRPHGTMPCSTSRGRHRLPDVPSADAAPLRAAS